MSQFPTMKAKPLLTILERKPLSYRVSRQSGSHRRMEAPGRPPLTFASTTTPRFPPAWFARFSSETLDLPKTRPGSYSDLEDLMETVRVIYHHEADGWWAESPDVEGWSAAGDTYAEVVKLAEEGVPFALEDSVELEHYVPASERVPV